MPNDLQFRPLTSTKGQPIIIWVNGEPLEARAGWSVAAALLAHGVGAFGLSAINGRPRGPWCMMGACFQCQVRIDGTPGRQACMTQAREGMRIDVPIPRGDV
ncbi:(2Fe-2S)-binding protein [Affinibrenneria salicis]|uniref:(2Fe-2S)-binding protein n=1 Tax=Affinibrenneria salicis TaxID=2590031 RepID=A0A5J5G6L2_9GAMM|nr:(2Fe-2S)-binding protein [Affinibrenneria salicis]KAA9002781.1 (2Fe-2S)-binding protein [Affinibrenneria salicis]KAA9002932.1 (2Fe-2S)-binding protein [Affinibrenneria salicis]